MAGLEDFLNLFAPPEEVERQRELAAQQQTTKSLRDLIVGNQQTFEADLFPGEQQIPGLSTGQPGALPESAQRDFIAQLLQSESPQFAQKGVGLADRALERLRQGSELRKAFQGEDQSLSKLLGRTAQIPDRFAQSISNLRQLETATPRPDFTNVSVDDTGQAHGFNIKTRQFEAIPQKDIINKFKTVQGVGADGLPETQLVRTSAFKDQDRISLPKGMTPETAAKKAIIDSGLKSLNIFKGLMLKDGQVDRAMLLNMNAPFGGTPGTQGRTANIALRDAIEAKLRAESGGEVPEGEVKRADIRFRPSLMDSDETIKTKSIMLEEFLNETSRAIRGQAEKPKAQIKAVDIPGLSDKELQDIIDGK